MSLPLECLMYDIMWWRGTGGDVLQVGRLILKFMEGLLGSSLAFRASQEEYLLAWLQAPQSSCPRQKDWSFVKPYCAQDLDLVFSAWVPRSVFGRGSWGQLRWYDFCLPLSYTCDFSNVRYSDQAKIVNNLSLKHFDCGYDCCRF